MNERKKTYFLWYLLLNFICMLLGISIGIYGVDLKMPQMLYFADAFYFFLVCVNFVVTSYLIFDDYHDNFYLIKYVPLFSILIAAVGFGLSLHYGHNFVNTMFTAIFYLINELTMLLMVENNYTQEIPEKYNRYLMKKRLLVIIMLALGAFSIYSVLSNINIIFNYFPFYILCIASNLFYLIGITIYHFKIRRANYKNIIALCVNLLFFSLIFITAKYTNDYVKINNVIVYIYSMVIFLTNTYEIYLIEKHYEYKNN